MVTDVPDAQWLLQRSFSMARTLGEAAMPSLQQESEQQEPVPPARAWPALVIRRPATAAIMGKPSVFICFFSLFRGRPSGARSPLNTPETEKPLKLCEVQPLNR